MRNSVTTMLRVRVKPAVLNAAGLSLQDYAHSLTCMSLAVHYRSKYCAPRSCDLDLLSLEFKFKRFALKCAQNGKTLLRITSFHTWKMFFDFRSRVTSPRPAFLNRVRRGARGHHRGPRANKVT